jgi:hypothetical protein
MATTTSTSNGSSRKHAAGGGSVRQQQQRLETRFPVNAHFKLTLSSEETVQGSIYCTDEVSQTVALQTSLTHTTLACDMRIIHAPSIIKAVEVIKKAVADAAVEEEGALLLSATLPKIQRKVLEERERKAIRMAEESLRHINQKVRV